MGLSAAQTDGGEGEDGGREEALFALALLTLRGNHVNSSVISDFKLQATNSSKTKAGSRARKKHSNLNGCARKGGYGKI